MDGSEISAELTARVATAPKARFHANGELVWEFNLRLFMDGRTETLTVRAPDQNYGALQNWVKPGALLFVRGWLHLARWRNEHAQDRARLILEPVELMPLNTKIEGSAPAAMDYSSRTRKPNAPGPVNSPDKGAKVIEELEKMLEEAQP